MNEQTPSAILRLRSLDKRFGDRQVLKDVSLELQAGVQVLVGANGAGKSTLLSIVAGVEPPSGGIVEIEGVNLQRAPARAKRYLTYVPDRPGVYPFLTGEEFIGLVLKFRGIAGADVESLLQRFALAELRRTRFGEMLPQPISRRKSVRVSRRSMFSALRARGELRARRRHVRTHRLPRQTKISMTAGRCNSEIRTPASSIRTGRQWAGSQPASVSRLRGNH